MSAEISKMSDEQKRLDRDALVEFWKLRGCWCHVCASKLGEEPQCMTLCPDCGCKRCPKATNHVHACSNSNDSGQIGSIYGENCQGMCCTEYLVFMAARAAEFDEMFPRAAGVSPIGGTTNE